MSLSYNRPSEALAAELSEVAEAAAELLAALQGPVNAPLPPQFPKDQLADICRTLIQLPQGTAEGCRTPLEYSRHCLPAIRRQHIRIDAKGTNADEYVLTRGTSIDIRIGHLISAVTTALDEYRRAAAEEFEFESPPEAAVTPGVGEVDDAINKSRAFDTSLENARRDLQEIAKPDSLPADELKRQLEDVQGLNRMSSAELRMPKVYVSWLAKLASSLHSYPDIVLSTVAKFKVSVDIAELLYDRWHEFKHRGVHFLFDELRDTATTFARVGKVLRRAQDEDLHTGITDTYSLPDACIAILKEKGSPMTSKQLLAELQAKELIKQIRTVWSEDRP